MLLLYYILTLLQFPGQESRAELHEMRVPSALAGPWDNLSGPVYLSSYFLNFIPVPNDRMYKSFGLFIKKALPVDVHSLEIDLHLSHGRSVITKFIPSGVTYFDEEQVSVFSF